MRIRKGRFKPFKQFLRYENAFKCGNFFEFTNGEHGTSTTQTMCRPLYALLIAIGIICCFSSLNAQSSRIDSLTHLLSNHQEDDTVKLRLLVDLSESYAEMRSGDGLKFGKQAIVLSEQLGHKRQNALAHYFVALGYDYSGEYPLALESYQTASPLLEALQMNEELAYGYSNMSRLYRNKGDYDEAMAHIKEAREINETRSDLVSLSDNLDKMGTLKNELGQVDSAMHYYKRALALREQMKDSLAIAKTMFNIAYVFQAEGKDDDALEYAYKALSNFENEQDTLYMAGALTFIGYIRMRYNDTDLAREHLKRALVMFKAIDQKAMVVRCLNTLAFTHTIDNDYEQALLYYKESLQIAEAFNFEVVVAEIFEGMSQCYGLLEQYDLSLQYANGALEAHEALDIPREIVSALIRVADVHALMGTYHQAISYVDRAFSVLESDNSIDLKLSVHESAFMAHEGAGNYKQAYKYLNDYMVLNDSLNTVETSTEIANLTSVYDLKEQESENEVLRLNQELDEATIKRQNNLIAAAVLIIVILAILAFIVYRGLVQRRRMSTHLAGLNEQLNQSNEKLKALDDFRTRFFANVNHDFRSPLTLIKGYVDRVMTNQTNFLSKESEQDLEHLRDNAGILSKMTGQILNLISLDDGKLDLQWNKINVVTICSAIQKMYHSMSEVQGKKLELHVASDEFVIHADLGYFRKILYNLISNAFRYTSTGAVISIHIRNTGGKAEIKVADTGQGIDPAHLPHIFDRFYQEPGNDYKSVEGFGIGLALVKELVEVHEGCITAESELGKGTTFTLTLPHNLHKPAVALAEESVPELPAKTTSVMSNVPSGQLSDKKNTLLVVDDHEEIRHYIVSSLNHTYEVRQAVHGKEALEILEKEKIDLIITDLMMPWLDGFGLIDEVRQSEKWQHIPVMVVSARTTEEDKLKVLDAGVNDFIAKPFDLVELTKKIENHIGALDIARKNTWQAVAENKDLKSNLEQNILKKINQLIIDRIEDPSLKVEDLADEICASQRKTHDLLKSLTGQPPKTYIKEVRLEYVHNLIVSEKVNTATEAARAIGMKNGTEFKKQYMNKFGVAPFASSVSSS